MATSSEPKISAFTSETDLSTHQYKIVKLGTTEKQVVLCGAGERGIGVLQNKPTAGTVAEVAMFGGGALVKCVGIITAGNSFASDANGFAKAAAATQFCLGVAMKTSAANDVISCELAPHFFPA